MIPIKFFVHDGVCTSYSTGKGGKRETKRFYGY